MSICCKCEGYCQILKQGKRSRHLKLNPTKAKDRDTEKGRRANGTDGDMNTNENGDGDGDGDGDGSRSRRGKEDYFSNIQTTTIQRPQFSSYQFDVQIWI